MRIWTLALMAAAAVLAGCTMGHMGGPADNDQNVLTGGPVTGTTLEDLPKTVKNTLKDKFPNVEIEAIVKQKFSNRIVYEFSFIDSDKTPNIRIADNGQILPDAEVQR